MSSSSDRDRAQAHTDNFFANGGNNNDDGQDLVWNPATGTFDTSGSSSMGGQMDVMVSTTKDGHFASAAQGDDMVFNEATGEFVAASLAATPQATEVQEAVPAHPAMMDVMKSTTKDGHFADVKRLKAEASALNTAFPGMPKSLSPTSATVLYKGRYTVRVEYGSSFPNAMPECFLEDSGLRFKNGTRVSEMGCSHEYHLLAPSDGRAQICHGRSSAWRPNNSLASVFVKAFMWLEAYENHLKTGHSLDQYLKTQAS
eukprot:CAMPEP_0119483876 /NCGR_PEP_ID=MMETSP1344-20130328/11088_1 /TAXON_ID=236787 /ORGANISM="Florenciella parvula, Strain CCMP2471" /LENGTH=256 /DNA_ID=CAMNT_0007518405 /DNA_START=178 /DNA_END=948 /DNA_ORIENTATION=-